MTPMAETGENEWLTRKKRIDPKLDAAGWHLRGESGSRRTEEEPTGDGNADYALWLESAITGVVEAKKLTVSPSGVLTQAERYAKALPPGPYNFNGKRCPFLYSTNGEVIHFHDVRDPLNTSRTVKAFHTPDALREMLARDTTTAIEKLLALPHDHDRLREYQKDANAAVEKAISERKRRLLLAMATGTGKTYTLVNQVYRLMKSGVAKRVLFLVDRRALAAQAVRAFASFEPEPGLKFDKIYEVYSSKFQADDFEEDQKFDPNVLPNDYLTNPQAKHTFVYVCTIQRMASNLFGRFAEGGDGGDEDDDTQDASQLDIPIHAFDLIVADECHRGYTAQVLSRWRDTLDHFDAIKIGLTATPAKHTSAYFQHLAFSYPYKQAVAEGHLVDYDVVRVKSDAKLGGVFLKEGEVVEVVDPETGMSKIDLLEDERGFQTTDLEKVVTSPDSNAKIIAQLKHYAEQHEQEYGRFPKTLIFAVNDLPHTSHADQLVTLARDAFGRGEDFAQKITGRVDKPLRRIREFRNRPNPGIAVTVDLLSTGVDIPDLEFIVLTRPIQSRILFEQIIGRGTRKGEKYPDKSHFTVFDCFDGSLLKYFRDSTGVTSEKPVEPTRKLEEIIEDIWQRKDFAYNVSCLTKRLHRVAKQMSGEAQEQFAEYIPDGDVASYAKHIADSLKQDFTGTMKLLRHKPFQHLLINYPRPPKTFIKAIGHVDDVSSEWLIRDREGNEYKPDDYITAFAQFVGENRDTIEAFRILLEKPKHWRAEVLKDLRQKLAASPFNFTPDKLQKAHERSFHKAMVDLISMVKHAADAKNPLLTADERATAAVATVTAGMELTPQQQGWMERIREVVAKNLTIEEEDFDNQPALSHMGGWGAARKAFGEDELRQLIQDLNEAVAA
jgi:type I restriction enzyme R subunit